jgi:peroxiredoxin
MAQFEPHKEQVLRNGSLVFIAAQKPGNILSDPAEFLVKTPTAFPYLLDVDRSATKAYGVYLPLSYDSIRIARPATFVVDSNGMITYLYVGSNQFDRAPVEQVLQSLVDAARAPASHQT